MNTMKIATILFNEEGFLTEVGKTNLISSVISDVLFKNFIARLPPTPYGGFPINQV